ncbi:MAG: 30S ribosomal protein S8 [Candidatus Margulisiibacteriota bacterium]
MTDPIGDMLSRIKNAQGIRANTVDVPHSKEKAAILHILSSVGYVEKVEEMKRMEKKILRVGLKYRANKKGLIAGFKRISRPGRRIYTDASKLPRVQSGFGTAVISTSKGIMTEQSARTQKLGGEVMLYVW